MFSKPLFYIVLPIHRTFKSVLIMSLFSEKLISLLLFAILLTSCPKEDQNRDQTNRNAELSLETLYKNSSDYEAYIADLQNEKWRTNFDSPEPIREDLLAAAMVIPGSWKLMVINDSETVDAVNTLPHIAKLVNKVQSLKLRITNTSKQAIQIAGRYQTYNGRNTFPVVLLIDENYREVGCWIERPAELQRRFSNLPEGLSDKEIEDFLNEWYQLNGGVRTIDEITKIIRAANTGDRICPVPEEGLRGS